jgi:hypothetical protein
MEEAVEQICKANKEVDFNPPYLPGEHFDAEHFSAGVDILQARVRELMNALRHDDAESARKVLGRALHTLQDFYAHTNWVELGKTAPNSDLNPPVNKISYPTSTLIETTCDGAPSDIITRALTSGYYMDELDCRSTVGPCHFDFSGAPPAGPRKCIHGGAKDHLAFSSDLVFDSTLGINKDSRSSEFSPHHDRHTEAAALAAQATAQFITAIKDNLAIEVGLAAADRKMCLLLGADALTLQNNNRASAATVSIDLDNGLRAPFPVLLDFLPLQVRDGLIPDLSAAGPHTLVVQGISSESFTGLIGYTLTLPSFLEFVEVSSDRGAGAVDLSGLQTHSDLLVLKPVSGPAHRINTYTIQRVGSTPPPILP